MKTVAVFIITILAYCGSLFAQPGSSCSTPIPLIFDGVLRSYATSASTGGTVVCPSSGSTPVTYFSITTGAPAETPLLRIIAPGGVNCEVAMYNGACSGGNLESTSSMCFYDGQGLWAPAETFALANNTTYNLRIKTPIAGNIQIAAQFYTPSNEDCQGATNIGPTPITDNNACHHGGPTVTPIQLCAFSLENTAFYAYKVATSGISTIHIENILCDNGPADNSSGFQIGFFTGSCAALTYRNCVANTGSTIVANAISLPAGTKVYVAIDGTAGSNCEYQISATNAEPLPASIRYFTGWKNSNSNILKWQSIQEIDNDYFEVERSENGKDFIPVGRVAGLQESLRERNYQVVDPKPPVKAFYRLKQVDLNGFVQYYKTIAVIRTESPYIHLAFQNPVTNNLLMDLQSNFKGVADLSIIALTGQVMFTEKVRINKGTNTIYRNLSGLPQGKYALVVSGEDFRTSQLFFKTNTLLGK